MAIGLGGTYLTHNEGALTGYLFGMMAVDPKAPVIEQAKQFGEGYQSGSFDKLFQRAEAEAEAHAAQRRAVAAGWGPGQQLPPSQR